MTRSYRHSILFVLVASLVTSSPALGQSLTLPYLKTPETPKEYWAATKDEVRLGNFGRAARMMEGFWKSINALDEEQQTKELLGFYDREGMSAFLKLGNIKTIRAVKARDPSTEKEEALVDLIVVRVNKAVESRLSDPKRIQLFVDNLSGTNEERAYAVTQLREAGAKAVPFLVNIWMDNTRATEHDEVFSALLQMGPETIPPLLAALDCNNSNVKSLVIRLCQQKGDKRILPYLKYLQMESDSADVRQIATTALGRLTTDPQVLQEDPKLALAKKAADCYNHNTGLPAGDEHTLWTWKEGSGLVSERVTRSQWEEKRGLDWARKSLDLDPAYMPAQVLFLSLVLDKAYERAGPQEPLSKSSPETHNLLAATGSSLLRAVLERAIRERRTSVALGATRAMIDNGHWSIMQMGDRGLHVLNSALDYPDRRVQLAAAEAVLRIPTGIQTAGNPKVIEVLRKAVASDGKAQAVIAHPDPAEARAFGDLFRELGYKPVIVQTGRELVRVMGRSPDVDLIALHARLTNPTLPYVLSQVRSDTNGAAVPIVVVGPENQERQLQRRARPYRAIVVTPQPVTGELLKEEIAPLVSMRTPLTEEERKMQRHTALEWLGRIARGEINGYDLQPADGTLIQVLADDDVAAPAAEVLAYRPGRAVQSALADLTAATARPVSIRTSAAKHLREHIRRNGILMGGQLAARLVQLSEKDAALAEEIIRLRAGLLDDPSATGDLLKSFNNGGMGQ